MLPLPRGADSNFFWKEIEIVQLHLSKGHFSVVSKKAEFLLKTESGYLRDAKML